MLLEPLLLEEQVLDRQVLDPVLQEQALELALARQETAQAAEEQPDKVVSLRFKILRLFLINSNLYKYLHPLHREDGLHPQEERPPLDQMVSLYCCHIFEIIQSL